jgi:carboxypeptidase C (cathepsin A)
LHVFGADAALDAYQFLVNWYKSYSEYNNNELYIIGESYGGKQFVVLHLLHVFL